jgi:hypothetical protein
MRITCLAEEAPFRSEPGAGTQAERQAGRILRTTDPWTSLPPPLQCAATGKPSLAPFNASGKPAQIEFPSGKWTRGPFS